MQPPRQCFREYDIRGVADRDLDDALVHALGRAFVAKLDSAPRAGTRLTVAVARDCRLSSDRLFAALSDGLAASGADVIDIGVGPTPMLYFAAHHLETDGAVMITGSHNPAEDNGFKLMQAKATLFGDDVRALADAIEAHDFRNAPRGSIAQRDVCADYVASIAEATRLPPLPSDFRVVVDAGNGSAGPLGMRALSALGIHATPLFCDMDGRFPNHHPDPTVEENLVALRREVQERRATLGIAWDGDGDRIGVIDDAGEVIWGDRLMILFSRAVLAESPGATILGEVKCSQTLFDDIALHGGRPVVCRTGHSLIKQRMKQEKALLAGEMSGHIFFADRYPGFDDAIYAAARLIELIAREKRSPREMLSDVPRTAVTPEIRLTCADELKFRVVDGVIENFRATHPVLEVDGARIDFGDGAWGLCRASNTGPVLVLRFEARTPERRDQIRGEVERVVERIKGILAAG